MNCKVVLVKGNAVVVSYREAGAVRTRLLSGTVTDTKVGQVLDISDDTLSTGTDYGIDWDVLMPGGFSISSRGLQNAMADRGVYTTSDIQKNPKLVREAVAAITNRLFVKIYKEVKNIGG
jgi:hypothetical protein